MIGSRRIWVFACFVLLDISFLQIAYGADGPSAKQMIDAIANDNEVPKLVEKSDRTIPRFPVGFDRKEQDRVVKAISSLASDDRVEVWEELLLHAGDKRYCITYSVDEFASNQTVGNICFRLAAFRLQSALFDCIDDSPSLLLKFDLPIGFADDPAAWRRMLAAKKLYELQIECLDAALVQLPTIDGLSPQTTTTFRDEIVKKRLVLKKNMVPSFTRFKFPGDRFHIFNE